MKNLLHNKKGTAEVIGTVMFIVILLFFFTNVYLWHDAASKQMNDLYSQKLNSPITVTYTARDSNHPVALLNVTNAGGTDAIIAGVWVNEKSSTGIPDAFHKLFNSNNLQLTVTPGGPPVNIKLPDDLIYDPTGHSGIFRVITTVGNIASCPYNQ
jgi:hypothetical protein